MAKSISRKSFLQAGAAAAGGIAALGALAPTAMALAQEAPAAGEAGIAEAPAAEPTPSGTFTATARGFGGDVTVTITLQDGVLVGVEALGPDETEGVGGAALPEYVQRTLDKQSADIDVVTGATYTLKGYQEAVNDALSKAL